MTQERETKTAVEQPFRHRQYWEERLSAKWGLHGVGHISYGKPYNEWLYRVRRRVFLRHITSLPIAFEQSTVLDIGSGTGFWVSQWKSLGVRSVVGSDLTQVAVRNLQRENPRTEILELDITDSKMVQGLGRRFDLISAFDVLFHITDDRLFEVAIRNIASLLRPGGYFLFSDCLLRERPRRAAHEVDRTLEEFERALRLSDLEVMFRAPIFFLMNTPVDLPSDLPQTLWRFVMLPVRFLPSLGHIYGMLLFPLEIALTALIREGPSAEMMACRRIASPRKSFADPSSVEPRNTQ